MPLQPNSTPLLLHFPNHAMVPSACIYVIETALGNLGLIYSQNGRNTQNETSAISGNASLSEIYLCEKPFANHYGITSEISEADYSPLRAFYAARKVTEEHLEVPSHSIEDDLISHFQEARDSRLPYMEWEENSSEPEKLILSVSPSMSMDVSAPKYLELWDSQKAAQRSGLYAYFSGAKTGHSKHHYGRSSISTGSQEFDMVEL